MLVFIQYTKLNIYPGNYHLFFLRPSLIIGYNADTITNIFVIWEYIDLSDT